jgi:hypothetical protein
MIERNFELEVKLKQAFELVGLDYIEKGKPK